MRNLITLILCAFSIILKAQTPTIDSSWISLSAGIYTENRLVAYASGQSTTTSQPIGDTTAVTKKYQEEITNRTASMATDIEVVSDYARQIREIVRKDAHIKSLIGRSPIDAILLPVRQGLIDSTYKVRIDGKNKNFKFSVTAQGVFRYKVDTFTVRQANYLGNVIRFQNWLNSGKPLDIFLFKNGRWYDSRREVQLFLQSAGPQNREVSLPDIAPFEESVAGPAFYAGGYVQLSGKWYKYSAKAWKLVKAPKSPIPQRP